MYPRVTRIRRNVTKVAACNPDRGSRVKINDNYRAEVDTHAHTHGGGMRVGRGGEQEKQGDPKESKIGCTCEQCDLSGRRCPSERYIPIHRRCLDSGFDVEEAKRALAATTAATAAAVEEERKAGRGRERERETWSSYQVPIPSRHHAGITVPGCLIGFNRNRQSSAAEFRKETAVLSSCSSSSIYERPPFVRP